MKKDESVFVRAEDTPSRESVYNFFSGTNFHVYEPPRVAAKVTMRTDQHDPDFFQDIAVNIQIRYSGATWDPKKLGGVTTSLDLLLTCDLFDIIPWAQNHFREEDEMADKDFGNELLNIGATIHAYAKAFVGLGTELTSVAEANEREAVRAFLSGEVLNKVAGMKVWAYMPVHNHNREEFKGNTAVFEIERLDGSYGQRIITTMDRIHSFGILAKFAELDIIAETADTIEEHIRHQLLRFETLGPVPAITPDASYNATLPVDNECEALHGLIPELERAVNEWELLTDAPFPFVPTLDVDLLVKYRDPAYPNQEDLERLIQLSKRVTSQARKPCYTDPFNTNHS